MKNQNQKLREGKFVFVIKRKKDGQGSNRYLAIVRRITDFDYGRSIVVEFFGGKRESLRENEIEPISKDTAVIYLSHNFIGPILSIDSNIIDIFTEEQIFSNISEAIQRIIC